MKNAFLILSDGTVFEGKSIGKEGITIGETVFTTGMTGYLETLTDPSYYGQITVQTFPLIGNYGVIPKDFESKKIHLKGYVVRELCEGPSNFRSEGVLNDFLKSQNITGIQGIDTRALTKKLRDSGVMNGMIVSGEENIKSVFEDSYKEKKVSKIILKKISEYKIEDAVKNVQERKTESAKITADKKSEKKSSENKKNHIVLWDFGAKENIIRELEKRGCEVTVASYNTSAEEILKLSPKAIMLSNGPGDPAENVSVINEIKKICEYNRNAKENKTEKQIPIFGICLGHQLLALAQGAKTVKLKYGHRGGNHPVKDLETGRVFITSQNHGYAVDSKTLPQNARESFTNANDFTCEGVTYTDILAFSVQFHPEACGGPHDTNFLFDRFLNMVKEV